MAVPEFDEAGYLPEGRHEATADEVREALVDQFPQSETRPMIHEGWRRHYQALEHLVPVEKQWIGGSFVSAKVDPSDIDICSFIDGPTYDERPEPVRDLVDYMTAHKITQAFWTCDSYPVVVYPEGSPGHDAYKAAVEYWHGWWGKTRADADGNQRLRGYLEVQ